MTKKKTKKIKSTFEEFMEAKTPEQRKKFEEEYRDLLFSEMILAAKEKDEVHIRKLAKHAGISPAVIQKAKIIKLVKENPDLTYEFIKNILIAQQEALAGKVEPY